MRGWPLTLLVGGRVQGDISLKKVRGGNAHHQLESAFKAFARAFRAALDRMMDPAGPHGCAEATAGPPPQPLELPKEPRRAERRRATKETTIEVRVDLDAPWSLEDDPTGAETVWTEGAKTPSQLSASVERTSRISSGIEVLDRVLVQFAKVRRPTSKHTLAFSRLTGRAERFFLPLWPLSTRARNLRSGGVSVCVCVCRLRTFR